MEDEIIDSQLAQSLKKKILGSFSAPYLSHMVILLPHLLKFFFLPPTHPVFTEVIRFCSNRKSS